MLKYLDAYGDIGFEEVRLCDADRLVFAQLVYLDFSGACPGDKLRDALVKVDFSGAEVSEVRFGFQKRDDMRLLRGIYEADRYAEVRLMDFTRIADEGTTFAAMTLELPIGRRMIVYRGTDNSLAGWKEDFELAYRQEIPSHRYAVEYVRRMARGAAEFEIIGHSKGGHLALYAATGLDDDMRPALRAAVSFDGPGFSREIMEARDFDAVKDRMCVIIPRSSVVGLLFSQPVERLFVESRHLGVLQHYPYFWKINGGGLQVCQVQTASARIFGLTVQGLLREMAVGEREKLIESVYEILCATNAETLNDMVRGWFSNTIPVARALLGRDRDTYKLFIRTIMAFLRSAAKALDPKNTEDD